MYHPCQRAADIPLHCMPPSIPDQAPLGNAHCMSFKAPDQATLWSATCRGCLLQSAGKDSQVPAAKHSTAQHRSPQQQCRGSHLVLLGGQLLGHISLDPPQHKGLQDALHALRQGILRILTMQV